MAIFKQENRSLLGFTRHICQLHHRSFWVKAARFIVAMVLLFLMLYLGKIVSLLVPIGIPDSIWGLLILFILLLSKLIKVAWISPASRPLLRYMTLFFLPICSGILEQSEMLKQHLNTVLFANFISTVLSLVIIGYLAQWLFTQAERSND